MTTSQATPCAERTCSGSSSRSPRPAPTSIRRGRGRAGDALLALNEAAGAARAAGQDAIDADTRDKHEDWYRKAAETGIALNAARQGKLQQKRNALATRMKDREADYLRVPFSNYPDAAVMPMFAGGGGPAAGQGGALAA